MSDEWGDDPIILGEAFNTFGIIDARDHDPVTPHDDPESALIDGERLQELLEIALRFEGDMSDFHLIVEREKPILLLPRENERELGYVLAPKVVSQDDPRPEVLKTEEDDDE